MTAAPTAISRRAWIAGASGLVGREILERLQSDDRCARIDVLGRRTLAPTTRLAAKVVQHRVDFAAMPADLPGVDDVYVALGTTIAVAGSRAAFRAIDFDAVLAVAHAGRVAGATRLAVVSALGADARSKVFYNRVKGEMEDAVAALGYASVAIARPSLITGDRASLGQRPRRAESLALRALKPLAGFVPRSIRPVAAFDVARSLVAALASGEPGVRLLSSAEMQPRDGAR